MSHDAFISDVARLLGRRGWTRDSEVMEAWLTDWRGRYTGRAIGMASPADTVQVASLVRLCAKYGVPIVPQGGNSSMSGGATPDDTGKSIILSLRRMDRIRAIDVDARQIVCDAGVILQNLHAEAARHDLRFPLTLGGKGSATVGGLIATNAGGTQVLRHGTMRAQVLGLEAVLADGSVLDVLPSLKKDNRGFDLKQLLIGSEGTLGIVTAARLRLLPKTTGRRVAWVGLDTLQQARKLLVHCENRLAGMLEGFEIVPRHCLDAVLDHLPDARPPLKAAHAWNALIECVVRPGDPDLAETFDTVLHDASEQDLLGDAVVAANESQADTFWQLRDTISPAERALGPAVQHDISVPVADMADFIDHAIPAVEQAYSGCTAIAFGHLGDGNVHFHVLAPEGAERGAWEEGQGKMISTFVHDCVTEWNGSISAEHGIGQMKRDEFGRLGDPVALAVMRHVKQAMDPQGLLNPGKLVPLAQGSANP